MANNIFANYPDVISVDDLQVMLHIGRNAAYALLKSGAIVTIRVGKKYIIPKASVIDSSNFLLEEVHLMSGVETVCFANRL